MSLTNYRQYATNGSSALAPFISDAPELILFEGGKDKNRPSAGGPQTCPASVSMGVAGAQLLFAILVSALIAGSIFTVDALASSRIEANLSEANSVTVNVRKGDSLWSIASEHGVDGCSTKDVVEWIKGQNHLSTSNIIAGQKLIVPSPSQL